MSTQNTKRKRWPWVVGGGVGAVVLIVGGAVAYNELKPDNTPAPITTSVAPAPSATPQPTGSAPAFDGRGPNGCAGGEAINADMVLAAQAQAQQDTDGAVEVAAAFTRWLVRDPLPSTEEADRVQQQVMASDAFTDDLAGYVAQGPELLPAGAENEAHLTTLNGVWQIERSSPEAVTVSIGARGLVDGAVDPANAVSISVDVVWEDGVWKIQRGENRVSVDVLFQNGIEFDGGC